MRAKSATVSHRPELVPRILYVAVTRRCILTEKGRTARCAVKTPPMSLMSMPEERPATGENADGAILRENSVEHKLVTDTERQADRQTQGYISYPNYAVLSLVKTQIYRHQTT